jgi:hypothetical protein
MDYEIGLPNVQNCPIRVGGKQMSKKQTFGNIEPEMEIWPTQTYHQEPKPVGKCSGERGEQVWFEKFLREKRSHEMDFTKTFLCNAMLFNMF